MAGQAPSDHPGVAARGRARRLHEGQHRIDRRTAKVLSSRSRKANIAGVPGHRRMSSVATPAATQRGVCFVGVVGGQADTDRPHGLRRVSRAQGWRGVGSGRSRRHRSAEHCQRSNEARMTGASRSTTPEGVRRQGLEPRTRGLRDDDLAQGLRGLRDLPSVRAGQGLAGPIVGNVWAVRSMHGEPTVNS
jgi:hypothetical protein